MTPKFYGFVKTEHGHPFLDMPDSFREYITKFKDRGAVCVTVTKPKSKATWSMFKYLFGGQYKLILEEMGEYPSEENLQHIHRLMKDHHGTTEVRDELQITDDYKIERMHDMVRPKNASSYTVEEMQLFWQGNQQFGAEMLGLNIPDPDPDWKESWKKERKSK